MVGLSSPLNVSHITAPASMVDESSAFQSHAPMYTPISPNLAESRRSVTPGHFIAKQPLASVPALSMNPRGHATLSASLDNAGIFRKLTGRLHTSQGPTDGGAHPLTAGASVSRTSMHTASPRQPEDPQLLAVRAVMLRELHVQRLAGVCRRFAAAHEAYRASAQLPSQQRQLRRTLVELRAEVEAMVTTVRGSTLDAVETIDKWMEREAKARASLISARTGLSARADASLGRKGRARGLLPSKPASNVSSGVGGDVDGGANHSAPAAAGIPGDDDGHSSSDAPLEFTWRGRNYLLQLAIDTAQILITSHVPCRSWYGLDPRGNPCLAPASVLPADDLLQASTMRLLAKHLSLKPLKWGEASVEAQARGETTRRVEETAAQAIAHIASPSQQQQQPQQSPGSPSASIPAPSPTAQASSAVWSNEDKPTFLGARRRSVHEGPLDSTSPSAVARAMASNGHGSSNQSAAASVAVETGSVYEGAEDDGFGYPDNGSSSSSNNVARELNLSALASSSVQGGNDASSSSAGLLAFTGRSSSLAAGAEMDEAAINRLKAAHAVVARAVSAAVKHLADAQEKESIRTALLLEEERRAAEAEGRKKAEAANRDMEERLQAAMKPTVVMRLEGLSESPVINPRSTKYRLDLWGDNYPPEIAPPPVTPATALGQPGKADGMEMTPPTEPLQQAGDEEAEEESKDPDEVRARLDTLRQALRTPPDDQSRREHMLKLLGVIGDMFQSDGEAKEEEKPKESALAAVFSSPAKQKTPAQSRRPSLAGQLTSVLATVDEAMVEIEAELERRRKWADMNFCCTKIQTIWRGHHQRVLYAIKVKVGNGAARKIQAAFRGHTYRRRMGTLMQLRRASVRIESWWRVIMAKKKVAALRTHASLLKLKHAAATRFQSIGRGMLARRRVIGIRRVHSLVAKCVKVAVGLKPVYLAGLGRLIAHHYAAATADKQEAGVLADGAVAYRVLPDPLRPVLLVMQAVLTMLAPLAWRVRGIKPSAAMVKDPLGSMAQLVSAQGGFNMQQSAEKSAVSLPGVDISSHVNPLLPASLAASQAATVPSLLPAGVVGAVFAEENGEFIAFRLQSLTQDIMASANGLLIAPTALAAAASCLFDASVNRLAALLAVIGKAAQAGAEATMPPEAKRLAELLPYEMQPTMLMLLTWAMATIRVAELTPSVLPARVLLDALEKTIHAASVVHSKALAKFAPAGDATLPAYQLLGLRPWVLRPRPVVVVMSYDTPSDVAASIITKLESEGGSSFLIIDPEQDGGSPADTAEVVARGMLRDAGQPQPQSPSAASAGATRTEEGVVWPSPTNHRYRGHAGAYTRKMLLRLHTVLAGGHNAVVRVSLGSASFSRQRFVADMRSISSMMRPHVQAPLIVLVAGIGLTMSTGRLGDATRAAASRPGTVATPAVAAASSSSSSSSSSSDVKLLPEFSGSLAVTMPGAVPSSSPPAPVSMGTRAITAEGGARITLNPSVDAMVNEVASLARCTIVSTDEATRLDEVGMAVIASGLETLGERRTLPVPVHNAIFNAWAASQSISAAHLSDSFYGSRIIKVEETDDGNHLLHSLSPSRRDPVSRKSTGAGSPTMDLGTRRSMELPVRHQHTGPLTLQDLLMHARTAQLTDAVSVACVQRAAAVAAAFTLGTTSDKNREDALMLALPADTAAVVAKALPALNGSANKSFAEGHSLHDPANPFDAVVRAATGLSLAQATSRESTSTIGYRYAISSDLLNATAKANIDQEVVDVACMLASLLSSATATAKRASVTATMDNDVMAASAAAAAQASSQAGHARKAGDHHSDAHGRSAAAQQPATRKAGADAHNTGATFTDFGAVSSITGKAAGSRKGEAKVAKGAFTTGFYQAGPGVITKQAAWDLGRRLLMLSPQRLATRLAGAVPRLTQDAGASLRKAMVWMEQLDIRWPRAAAGNCPLTTSATIPSAPSHDLHVTARLVAHSPAITLLAHWCTCLMAHLACVVSQGGPARPLTGPHQITELDDDFRKVTSEVHDSPFAAIIQVAASTPADVMTGIFAAATFDSAAESNQLPLPPFGLSGSVNVHLGTDNVGASSSAVAAAAAAAHVAKPLAAAASEAQVIAAMLEHSPGILLGDDIGAQLVPSSAVYQRSTSPVSGGRTPSADFGRSPSAGGVSMMSGMADHHARGRASTMLTAPTPIPEEVDEARSGGGGTHYHTPDKSQTLHQQRHRHDNAYVEDDEDNAMQPMVTFAKGEHEAFGQVMAAQLLDLRIHAQTADIAVDFLALLETKAAGDASKSGVAGIAAGSLASTGAGSISSSSSSMAPATPSSSIVPSSHDAASRVTSMGATGASAAAVGKAMRRGSVGTSVSTVNLLRALLQPPTSSTLTSIMLSPARGSHHTGVPPLRLSPHLNDTTRSNNSTPSKLGSTQSSANGGGASSVATDLSDGVIHNARVAIYRDAGRIVFIVHDPATGCIRHAAMPDDPFLLADLVAAGAVSISGDAIGAGGGDGSSVREKDKERRRKGDIKIRSWGGLLPMLRLLSPALITPPPAGLATRAMLEPSARILVRPGILPLFTTTRALPCMWGGEGSQGSGGLVVATVSAFAEAGVGICTGGFRARGILFRVYVAPAPTHAATTMDLRVGAGEVAEFLSLLPPASPETALLTTSIATPLDIALCMLDRLGMYEMEGSAADGLSLTVGNEKAGRSSSGNSPATGRAAAQAGGAVLGRGESFLQIQAPAMRAAPSFSFNGASAGAGQSAIFQPHAQLQPYLPASTSALSSHNLQSVASVANMRSVFSSANLLQQPLQSAPSTANLFSFGSAGSMGSAGSSSPFNTNQPPGAPQFKMNSTQTAQPPAMVYAPTFAAGRPMARGAVTLKGSLAVCTQLASTLPTSVTVPGAPASAVKRGVAVASPLGPSPNVVKTMGIAQPTSGRSTAAPVAAPRLALRIAAGGMGGQLLGTALVDVRQPDVEWQDKKDGGKKSTPKSRDGNASPKPVPAGLSVRVSVFEPTWYTEPAANIRMLAESDSVGVPSDGGSDALASTWTTVTARMKAKVMNETSIRRLIVVVDELGVRKEDKAAAGTAHITAGGVDGSASTTSGDVADGAYKVRHDLLEAVSRGEARHVTPEEAHAIFADQSRLLLPDAVIMEVTPTERTALLGGHRSLLPQLYAKDPTKRIVDQLQSYAVVRNTVLTALASRVLATDLSPATAAERASDNSALLLRTVVSADGKRAAEVNLDRWLLRQQFKVGMLRSVQASIRMPEPASVYLQQLPSQDVEAMTAFAMSAAGVPMAGSGPKKRLRLPASDGLQVAVWSTDVAVGQATFALHGTITLTAAEVRRVLEQARTDAERKAGVDKWRAKRDKEIAFLQSEGRPIPQELLADYPASLLARPLPRSTTPSRGGGGGEDTGGVLGGTKRALTAVRSLLTSTRDQYLDLVTQWPRTAEELVQESWEEAVAEEEAALPKDPAAAALAASNAAAAAAQKEPGFQMPAVPPGLLLQAKALSLRVPDMVAEREM